MRNLFLFLLIAMPICLLAQRREIDSLLRVYAASKPDSNRVKTLVSLSFRYRISKPDSAMLLIHQGLSLAKELHFKRGEMLALNTKGNVYAIVGEYSKALNTFLDALKIAEDLNSFEYQAKLFTNMSTVYASKEEYRTSINYLLKALETNRQWGDKLIDIASFSGLGSAYLRLKILDSSLIYLQKGYALANSPDISHQPKVIYLKGGILGFMGDLHEQLNQRQLAMEYYRLSMDIAQQEGDLLGLSDNHISMAQLYEKMHQPDSVLKHAATSLQIARESNFADEIIEASLVLSKYFKGNHQMDSAFFYHQLAFEAKDSVYSQQKVNEFQKIAFAEQIRQQEKENERIEAALKDKQKMQLAGIAAFIPFFFSIVFFFRRGKISNKRLEFLGLLGLLLFFEFITLLIHPFVEHITGHTPVYMLLILVAVAMVLVPLHHRLEHWFKKSLAARNINTPKAESAPTE